MKRKTFYYISLSLPYIALGFSGALTFLAYGIGAAWGAFPDGFLGILTGTLAFFSMSAIVWAPLYTWMVIVMLFWGRGKRANEVRTMYLLSPVLLACSMGIPAFLFFIDSSAMLLAWGFLHLANLDSVTRVLFKDSAFEESLTAGVAWGFMAVTCIVVGYLFVGVALSIERVLKRYNLFRGEEDAVGGRGG